MHYSTIIWVIILELRSRKFNPSSDVLHKQAIPVPRLLELRVRVEVMLLDGRQLALDGERRLLDLRARHLPLDEAVGQIARFLFQEVYPLTEKPILGPEALKRKLNGSQTRQICE